ncbi:MAG: glycerate kinase [Desulfobacterales bacterium]|jgi:hydroxypyruvate reductase
MPDALSHRQQLEHIFRAGLQRVDPYQMLIDRVRLEGNTLKVAVEGRSMDIDIGAFETILVIGAGKASASMAKAMEAILGDRINAGLVAVKYGHTVPLERIDLMESGHPVPDENGVAAAHRIGRMADSADEGTLVISLISGGGSAILPSPIVYSHEGRQARLSLPDKQAATRALLACGADIREMNCIRKHLSGLKGGRLLERISPARSLNFILSDVVGDDLSSIASGMTTDDPSTYADALAVIDKYGIADRIPEQAMEVLRLGKSGAIPETMKTDAFSSLQVDNLLVGTNRSSLEAASEKAVSLGYRVRRLTSRISGEAREVAKILAGIAMDVKDHQMAVTRPACIISGGEPVVTLKGKGKGGRNQEMALAFLSEMALEPARWDGIFFLAASTDGNDGPTDAAGAFADVSLLAAATRQALSLRNYLEENDAYRFFEAIGGLLKTGPTNTNVCDLQMILVP